MSFAVRHSRCFSRMLVHAVRGECEGASRRAFRSSGMIHCSLSRRTDTVKYPYGTRWLGSSSAPAQKHESQSSSARDTISGDTGDDKIAAKIDDTALPSDAGAIGGFMRGLIGGRDVAAEDAFVAEAKEQGIDIPPPPPHRRADLVPLKRRKRNDDDDEAIGEQTIRDRLFSRFGGSAFMRGALDAKNRIAERIDESDNPVINLFRNIYDRLFAENEMAMVVREIREDDPSFTVSEFLRQAEKRTIPDILSAYLAGDREKLADICTEDACRMLNASIREREAEGIIMDTNILDISDVELTAGRLLEDAPVLIVTFSAQQINCLRDRSGAIIEGAIDDIRSVYYVWAFVREVELEENVPSGGGIGDADSRPSESSDSPRESSSDAHGTSEKISKEEKLPRPWKMMEMVIRGAHSTL